MTLIFRLAISTVLLSAAAIAQSSQHPLPALKTSSGVTQMFVEGKPFVMFSGELHNSSASSVEYMKPIWDKLAKLHLNTVIGTVSWELLEPQEGKFDFTLVDSQIREARLRNMRLVLIWFASWKNASSAYAPLWVKTNTKRFPRALTHGRKDLDNPLTSFFASFMQPANLSPFGEESVTADAKAFRALMRHIKQVDPQHTVIMMQVENETGLLGDSRDRSEAAEAAWTKPVPSELLDYLVKHREHLLPETVKVWGKNGYRSSGTWQEVFGNSNQADEVFMSWYIGRYVGKVAAAGKAELALPMYVNAWLGPQPGMAEPGQYPSGGPVARMMDVWRAAAPSIDLYAPDIYVQDFKGTCAEYARSGNPLFIPEARAITGNLFWALGHESALGFSPFGVEDVSNKSQFAAAYEVLRQMEPMIARAQAEKHIEGVLLDGDRSEVVSIAGYKASVNSSRTPVRLDAGQTPLESAAAPADDRSFVLILSTAPDEFYLVGSGVLVNFAPDSPGPAVAEIGSMDEMRFANGAWTAVRRLNGDEGRPALKSGEIGVIRIRLYRRD